MFRKLVLATAILAALPASAHDRRDYDRDGRVCLEPVRGLGTQWVGEEGALEAAKKDWAERVRYDRGESFVDMTHARDFEKRCGRTSIGEVAGTVLYRCEIVARPCSARFEPMATPAR